MPERKPTTPGPRLNYLGIVFDAAGSTLVCVADSEKTAEKQLFALWRKAVYEGFQPDITNFEQLAEWSGCRVTPVPQNQAIDWNMYQPPA